MNDQDFKSNEKRLRFNTRRPRKGTIFLKTLDEGKEYNVNKNHLYHKMADPNF